MLVMVCHMLRDGVHYEELGKDYLERRSRESVKRNAVRKLQRLGYAVTIEEVA